MTKTRYKVLLAHFSIIILILAVFLVLAACNNEEQIQTHSPSYGLVVSSGSNEIRRSDNNQPVTLAGITWNGTSGVLTLSSVSLTTTAPRALQVPTGSRITVAGTNTITSSFSSTEVGSASEAIFCSGNLTIDGSGSLTATSGASRDSDGIYVGGSLTISRATVTVIGRNVGNNSSSDGIYVIGNMTIDTGAIVTATGGNVGDNSSSTGITLGNNMTINGGIVTATGGTIGTSSTSIGVLIYGTSPFLNLNPGSASTITMRGATRAIYTDTYISSTFGDYTVQNLVRYWTNSTIDAPNPLGDGNVSNGSFTITGFHRYARLLR
jgi:hypothetical protein